MIHWQYTPYALPLLVAVAISVALALYVWRHRTAPGATAFAVLMLLVVEWSLGYALELGSVDLPTKIFWAKVEYLGIVTLPLVWLVFALQYTGRERWLTRRYLVLLAMGPLITLSLVWTNGVHGLIWSRTGLDAGGPFPLLDVTYGAWFWVHLAFSHLLVLFGTILLVLVAFRSSRLYRQQAIALLIGVLAPWVANGLYVLDLGPDPNLDPTPFAFTLSGLALVWGLFRFRLLDIAPVARRAVVDGIGDGVIVLDVRNRVVDLNPAAQRIIGLPAADAIGRPASQVLADYPELVEHCRDVTEVRTEITLRAEHLGSVQDETPDGGQAERHYDLRISPLTDGRGYLVGQAVLLHDVTARKQAEEALYAQKQLFENLVAVARATAERPTLDATLQNALDVAATLTGAEHGGLFLLDKSGSVTQSILLRKKETPEQQQAIIAHIMDTKLAASVTGHRQAALVPDILQDERWLLLADRPHTSCAALAVPIVSGAVLVGVLTLLHSQPGYFSSEHLRLMQAAADQMSLALRNAQIFDAQRRIADWQITLYEVLHTVAEQTDPDKVAHVAVEIINQFAGWPRVAIAWPDEDGTYWTTRAASDAFPSAAGRTFPMDQGVIGRAFRTAQTQLVPDVSADPDYIAAHPSIRCELAVPLRRGGRTLGVLDIESDQPAAFDADDVLLAESLAETVALALDNAWLYEETRQQAANLDALYTVTRMASRSLSLEDVLSQALLAAISSLGFEAGMVNLADPTDGRLRLAVQRGLPDAIVQHLQHGGYEDTLCAHVYARRTSLVVDDLSQEARGDVNGLVASGFRVYAGIPLLHRNQPLGTMCLLTRQPRPSSTDDLAMLTAIGQQVATAVANARLFQAIADERSQLQALIESSRDGIILVGTDLRVPLINAPAIELLRLPGEPEDWADRRLQDILAVLRHRAPAVVQATVAEIRRIREGEEPPGEGEFEVPPRTIHWLNLPVMTDGAPLGRLLVLRDVTEERLLENMRDDLTHTMVHDLRNPIAAIYTSLQLMDQEAAGPLLPAQRSIMEIAGYNTQKALKLVNNILDVSRLESGRMPLECAPVSLADLIAETLQAQSPLAANKDLRLESDVPPMLSPVWADAGLIGQVLQNLVDNAIKFAPTGGLVRVTVKPGNGEIAGQENGQDSSASHLRVSVSDDGPGVPPELQSRLFQKFVTGRHLGSGSGLGLAFCKLAVEAHGERIWVESEPGQGTTFTFTLPVAPEGDKA
jgi:PAS domain S-box-containing protein